MSTPAAKPGFTAVKWLICVIASIGFAFDIYELLMLPLIAGPAMLELGGIKPGSPEFLTWKSILFYVPAFAGGLFGLFGGYLTDLLGRRRVLTWSILLYAVSAFLAGFATNMYMLLFLRCTTFVGVCVEFVAAIAWLAELFPDKEQREKVLGYTQAFSSIGGLLVAWANYLAIRYADVLPAIPSLFGDVQNHHAPWRYTLMSGLIPAIPLLVIRPFLPESPAWQAKRAAGTLKRPSVGELFAGNLARTTWVTTVLFACSYGAAFGTVQQMPDIVARLSDAKARTAALSQEKELKDAPPAKLAAAKGKLKQEIAAEYTKVQEIGGLLGRVALAFLAVRLLHRQGLLRVFQLPGLFVIPAVFYAFATWESNPVLFTLNLNQLGLGVHQYTWLHLGLGLCGFFIVAQFSFWGNYLPYAYPVHLRGTGESFAANIGGRMLGTSFAAVTLFLSSYVTGDAAGTAESKMAMAAMWVGIFVFGVGSVVAFFLPEPDPNALNDH